VLFLVVLSFPVHAQQRRPAPKPISKGGPSGQGGPTFETLLGDDAYKVYVEVRGVGQLIRSNSVNELLEPVMKLAEPPKEFKTLVKWLNTHADDVMTSRMLVAVWPTAKNVPDAVVAIEFDSPEEAAKFEPQLNSFLPKVMPTTMPEKSSSAGDARNKSLNKNDSTKTEDTTAKPAYYLNQVGSLIVITPTPLTLKNLRPAGSKLLTDNTNFRVAHNRFGSEQVFVFVDVDQIEVEEKNQRRQYSEEEKKLAEEEAKRAAQNPKSPEPVTDDDKQGSKPDESPGTPEVIAVTAASHEDSAPKPDALLNGLGSLASGFFGGQGKWPSAIGIGVSLEGDSFDVRALMVTAAAEKCDAVPFVPNFIPGMPIVPSSPSILPADTELFASLSLDLPQMYAAMSKPVGNNGNEGPQTRLTNQPELSGPFTQIENSLKIKLKDDLLPLLGSEIVISMPVKLLEASPLPKPQPAPQSTAPQAFETAHEPSFVVAISLKDKEGMRNLLPKIIDSVFKGASALGQTEKRDDTELVSYGNTLSYAFIENFLIISADAATTRHVVDSYLKHETLSSDIQFKNYTRWQPRQVQAQVYVSPALMASYNSFANQPSPLISDQMREILARLSLIGQPVTYSLSNDGLGTLHELHVPKNLVFMAVAGLASASNPSPIVANERGAISALYMISSAEMQYRNGEGKGNFASLEQLTANDMISKDWIANHGYTIQVSVSGNKFEITAIPTEYGTTGRTSYFLDETNVLRGGDHAGGAATVDDPPFKYN